MVQNFDDTKIRGIQEKRYNEEISGAESCPDRDFFVLIQNPG
jgi:hypothetical protein